MANEAEPFDNRTPLTEGQIRAATIGELKPLSGPIRVVDYDPRWPELLAREADRVRAAPGQDAIRVEHVGSTSVPGLLAKPIVDVLLLVADSADEAAYVPALEAAEFRLDSLTIGRCDGRRRHPPSAGEDTASSSGTNALARPGRFVYGSPGRRGDTLQPSSRRSPSGEATTPALSQGREGGRSHPGLTDDESSRQRERGAKAKANNLAGRAAPGPGPRAGVQHRAEDV